MKLLLLFLWMRELYPSYVVILDGIGFNSPAKLRFRKTDCDRLNVILLKSQIVLEKLVKAAHHRE